MKRLPVWLALLGMVSAAQTRAQTPAALTFEVASIKPTDPVSGRRGIAAPRANNSLTIGSFTLKELIQFAYGPGGGVSLPADLVVGGPKWLDDDRYDVVAKAAGNASQGERRQMLGTLLQERFHLVFHYQSKEASAYELSVGKNGPKLQEHKPDDGGESFSIRDKGSLHFICSDVSMAKLSMFLGSQVLGRPVSDKTGLSGTFDFDLNWRPDDSQFGGRFAKAQERESDLPDLFTALRDLGLRLEAVKAPVQFLVIDHAEKPSAN